MIIKKIKMIHAPRKTIHILNLYTLIMIGP
jgi:hypothetical protein